MILGIPVFRSLISLFAILAAPAAGLAQYLSINVNPHAGPYSSDIVYGVVASYSGPNCHSNPTQPQITLRKSGSVVAVGSWATSYTSPGDTGPATIQYKATCSCYGLYKTRSVTITGNTPPIGVFDSATASVGWGQNLSATGWAADDEMGAPVSRVYVRVNLGSNFDATLNGDRPDVANAYGRPDYRYSGWSYSFNTGSLAVGSHTAYAYAVDDNNQSTYLGSEPFVVVKANQTGVGGSLNSSSTTYPTARSVTATGGQGSGAYQFRQYGGSGTVSLSGSGSSRTITPTAAGTAVIQLRKLGNGNFNASGWTSVGTLTISKRPITITRSGSKAYNGNTTPTGAGASITSGSLAAGDSISYSFGSASSANVGTYAITVTPTISNGAAPATRTGSYAISYAGTYVITKASQTGVGGSLGASSVTYGSTTTVTASGGQSSGVYEFRQYGGSGTVSLSGSGSSRTITPTAAGTAVIQLRKLGNGNFNASGWTSAGTLTISERPITITRSGSKAYNGNTTPTGAAASITSGSLAAGDSIGYSYGSASSANAGTYAIAVTPTISNGAAPATRTGSYAISYAGTYAITKAGQTGVGGSLGASSVTYGSTTTVTASGGQSSGVYEFRQYGGTGTVSFSGSGSSRTITPTAAGTAVIQLRKLGNGNFNASGWTSAGTLTISERPITITRSGSKAYNGNTTPTGAAASITSGSLAAGDSIGYSYGSASSANTGTYAIAVTPTISNGAAPATRTGSYAISYAGTYAITKAGQTGVGGSLGTSSVTYGSTTTVTASGGQSSGVYEFRQYGGTGTVSFSGSGSSRTITPSATGTAVIQVRKLGNSNYNTTSWTSVGTLTINKRPITITRSGSKAYNGTTTPTGAGASITSGSLAAGDSISYSFGSASSASVGTYAIAVTPTISNGTSPATRTGSYAISYAGTYAITHATQSAPTVGASQSFVYGNGYAATSTGGGGKGSLQWERTGGTASGGAINASSGAVTAASTGTVAVRARWSGNANYAVSPWSTAVSISVNARPITITRSGSKSYNGNATPSGAGASITSGNLAPGDGINYAFGNASSANVGTYVIAVTPTILNGTSNRTSSYQISYAGHYSIAKASNVITFPSIPDQLMKGVSYSLNATASSGLPVVYSVVSGSASVTGSTLILGTVAGDVTVRASQAGDANYEAATPIDRTFRLWGMDEDTDGDGIPNYWEATVGLNPYYAGDANSDLDGDGVTNLEEYQAGDYPFSGDGVTAFGGRYAFHVKAKRSGTGPSWVRLEFANGAVRTFDFEDIPSDEWGVKENDEAVFLSGSAETTATVTSSGVSDYAVLVRPYRGAKSLAKYRVLINDAFVDGLTMQEIAQASNQMSIRLERISHLPFGEMDISLLENNRVIHFGLGHDVSGRSPGLVALNLRAYKKAVWGVHMRPILSLYSGVDAAVSGSLENGGTIQVEVPSGYLEIEEEDLTRYHVRFYKSQGDVLPVITYMIDLTTPLDPQTQTWEGDRGTRITRTIGSDVRLFETLTNWEHEVVSTSYTVPIGNGMTYQKIINVNRWDTTLDFWPWRKPEAPRVGLIELKYDAEAITEHKFNGPVTHSESVWLHKSIYDGPDDSSERLYYEARGFPYADYGLSYEPLVVTRGDGALDEDQVAFQTSYADVAGAKGVSVIDSLGGQVFTEYYRDAVNGNLGNEPLISDGQIRQTRRTFLDNTIGSAQDIVTSYSYDAELIDGRTMPETIVNTQDGREIGRTEFTNTVIDYGNGVDNAVKVVAKEHYAGGLSLSTTTLSYSRRLGDIDWAGKPISVKRPDETQTSFGYERGTFDAQSGSWTTDSSGDHLKIVELSGKTGSAVDVFSGGGSSLSIDPLDMEPNRSTATERIFGTRGELLREAMYVYLGSTGFELVNATYHDYDDRGNRVLSVDAPLGSTPSRIFYSAFYIGFRKTSETDAQGTKLIYEYDDYDRIDKITKEGVGTPGQSGYQPDVVTKFEYDGAGRVEKEIVGYNSTGNTLTTDMAYDTSGRLTYRKDAGVANATSITFDADDSTIRTITLPTGATRVENLHMDGRIDTVTGSAGPAVSHIYMYGADGNLVAEETLTATGQWIESHKDWLGREIKVVEPTHDGGMRQTIKVYNEDGQLARTEIKSGTVHLAPRTLYEYDDYGRLELTASDSHDSAYGSVEEIEKTQDSNVIGYYSDLRLDGGDWFLYETQSDYPYNNSDTGRMLGESFTQLSGLNAGVMSYSYSYDAHGNYSSHEVVADRTAKTVTSSMDVQGSVHDVVEVIVNGLLTEVTNEQDNTFKYDYDAIGRIKHEIDPRLASSHLLTYVYKPDSPFVDYVQNPDESQIHYGYDAAGRLDWQNTDHASTSVLKQYVRYDYDDFGNPLRIWGTGATPVRYEYNGIGQRKKMWTYRNEGGWTGVATPPDFSDPAKGDLTEWLYHPATGLLEQKKDDSGKGNTYSYDDLNRIYTRTDARQAVTTYHYFDSSSAGDGEFTGALRVQEYPDTVTGEAQITTDVEYAYYRNGLLETVTDDAGVRTFEYYDDAIATGSHAGSLLLKSETFDSSMFGGKAITHSYDYGEAGLVNGARKTLQYASAGSYLVGYDHSDNGRLKNVTPSYASAAFGYTYTPGSNLLESISHGNYTREYGYEADSGRIELMSDFNLQTILTETRAEYDEMGRKSVEKHRGDVFGQIGHANGFAAWYAYNLQDASPIDPQPTIDRNEQILSAKFPLDPSPSWDLDSATISGSERIYHYDAIGNRELDIDGAYAANSLNQYTDVPFNGGALSHDNGNVTNDGERSYSYDVENRLVEMTVNGDTYTYKYDYMGRRISKQKDGGTETRFVYDGWNLIAETGPSGNVMRSFVWGSDVSGSLQGAGGVGGLLMIEDGSAQYYPVYDASHNVVGLRNLSGVVVAAYEYDDFGNVVNSSGSYAEENPFRYSTKYTDDLGPSTGGGAREGLVYYGLRYYNPESGRFINRDPIEESGGLNLYGFVGNNPVNQWDYLGLNIINDLGLFTDPTSTTFYDDAANTHKTGEEFVFAYDSHGNRTPIVDPDTGKYKFIDGEQQFEGRWVSTFGGDPWGSALNNYFDSSMMGLARSMESGSGFTVAELLDEKQLKELENLGTTLKRYSWKEYLKELKSSNMRNLAEARRLETLSRGMVDNISGVAAKIGNKALDGYFIAVPIKRAASGADVAMWGVVDLATAAPSIIMTGLSLHTREAGYRMMLESMNGGPDQLFDIGERTVQHSGQMMVIAGELTKIAM